MRKVSGINTMSLGYPTYTSATPELISKIDKDGFATVASCLDDPTIERLSLGLDETKYAQRNLLTIPIVRELAKSEAVRSLLRAVLGQDCFAVRGILFNKTRRSNWKVVWHQDLTIAVRERRETDGLVHGP